MRKTHWKLVHVGMSVIFEKVTKPVHRIEIIFDAEGSVVALHDRKSWTPPWRRLRRILDIVDQARAFVALTGSVEGFSEHVL